MHSALISQEHSYPAFTLGRIAGTPEAPLSRSSRTKDSTPSRILTPTLDRDRQFCYFPLLADGPVISASATSLLMMQADPPLAEASTRRRVARTISQFRQRVGTIGVQSLRILRCINRSFLLIIPTERFVTLVKSQITMYKLQTIYNFKITMPKNFVWNFGHWILEFVCDLEIVIWNFTQVSSDTRDFPAYSQFQRQQTVISLSYDVLNPAHVPL